MCIEDRVASGHTGSACQKNRHQSANAATTQLSKLFAVYANATACKAEGCRFVDSEEQGVAKIHPGLGLCDHQTRPDGPSFKGRGSGAPQPVHIPGICIEEAIRSTDVQKKDGMAAPWEEQRETVPGQRGRYRRRRAMNLLRNAQTKKGKFQHSKQENEAPKNHRYSRKCLRAVSSMRSIPHNQSTARIPSSNDPTGG